MGVSFEKSETFMNNMVIDIGFYTLMACWMYEVKEKLKFNFCQNKHRLRIEPQNRQEACYF